MGFFLGMVLNLRLSAQILGPGAFMTWTPSECKHEGTHPANYSCLLMGCITNWGTALSSLSNMVLWAQNRPFPRRMGNKGWSDRELKAARHLQRPMKRSCELPESRKPRNRPALRVWPSSKIKTHG